LSECETMDDVVEDFSQGNMVCQKCVQFSHIIDDSPEWRQYNNDDGNNDSAMNRCGGAINFSYTFIFR